MGGSADSSVKGAAFRFGKDRFFERVLKLKAFEGHFEEGIALVLKLVFSRGMA
jgi:hypothetical protein